MVILPFYLERNVLCQLIHSVQLTQKEKTRLCVSSLFGGVQSVQQTALHFL